MNDKKVSKNRQKKEALVSELSEKVGKAKAFVFTNYQGLTHKQLEALKKALKSANSELVVTKNTLLKLALEKVQSSPASPKLQRGEKFKVQSKSFEGPTATVFVYEDIMQPLREIAKVIKQFNLPSIKFGILDGQALTGDQLLKMSALPSKEVLLAQFIRSLKSPIYGFHRALNWNLSKLVLTLKAIESKREVSQ